jgi:hypothetical protein
LNMSLFDLWIECCMSLGLTRTSFTLRLNTTNCYAFDACVRVYCICHNCSTSRFLFSPRERLLRYNGAATCYCKKACWCLILGESVCFTIILYMSTLLKYFKSCVRFCICLDFCWLLIYKLYSNVITCVMDALMKFSTFVLLLFTNT